LLFFAGSEERNQLNKIIEDYYSTLRDFNTTFLTPQHKKEAALEFVRIETILKFLEKAKLSSDHVNLISKHLKSTIYYVEAKQQQSDIFFNHILLASLSTLCVFLILLFCFTIWYERQRKVKIMRRQQRIRQVHLDIENLKKTIGK
jgi:hypothetical protein